MIGAECRASEETCHPNEALKVYLLEMTPYLFGYRRDFGSDGWAGEETACFALGEDSLCSVWIGHFL